MSVVLKKIEAVVSKGFVYECGGDGNCGPLAFAAGLRICGMQGGSNVPDGVDAASVRKKVCKGTPKMKNYIWWDGGDFAKAAKIFDIPVILIGHDSDVPAIRFDVNLPGQYHRSDLRDPYHAVYISVTWGHFRVLSIDELRETQMRRARVGKPIPYASIPIQKLLYVDPPATKSIPNGAQFFIDCDEEVPATAADALSDEEFLKDATVGQSRVVRRPGKCPRPPFKKRRANHIPRSVSGSDTECSGSETDYSELSQRSERKRRPPKHLMEYF